MYQWKLNWRGWRKMALLSRWISLVIGWTKCQLIKNVLGISEFASTQDHSSLCSNVNATNSKYSMMLYQSFLILLDSQSAISDKEISNANWMLSPHFWLPWPHLLVLIGTPDYQWNLPEEATAGSWGWHNVRSIGDDVIVHKSDDPEHHSIIKKLLMELSWTLTSVASMYLRYRS